MRVFITIAIVCGLAFSCAHVTSARTWTDSTGKHKIEAELVEYKGGVVKLKRTDGKELSLAIEKLSEEDQEFVQQNVLVTPSIEIAENLSIPCGRETPITASQAGCPVVVVGKDVWSLEKGTIKKTLELGRLRFDQSQRRCLSPDGRWFACTNKDEDRDDNQVTVWSAETGKIVAEIPGTPYKHVDALSFCGANRLAVVSRHKQEIALWDLSTGTLEQVIELEVEPNETGVAFTSDGKYCAILSDDEYVVIETDSKQRKVTIQPQPRMRGDMQQVAPGENLQPDSGDRDLMDFGSSLGGLSFSIDDQWLAACNGALSPRLTCWDKKGRIDTDTFLPHYISWIHATPSVQWFPNSKAWLMAGCVVDRETRRTVMAIQHLPHTDPTAFVVGNSQLLAVRPSAPISLTVLEVPWEAIRGSLSAMQTSEDSIFSPANPVRIELNSIDEVPEVPNLRELILESAKRKLRMDRIPISDDAELVLRIRVHDKTVPLSPVRQYKVFAAMPPPNCSAEDAHGELVLEIIDSGSDEVLWRDIAHISVFSTTFREEVARGRLSAEAVELGIRHSTLPYVIPKSADLPVLPLLEVP